MLVILTTKQRSTLREYTDHLLIALEDILPNERGDAALLSELAIVIHGRKEF